MKPCNCILKAHLVIFVPKMALECYTSTTHLSLGQSSRNALLYIKKIRHAVYRFPMMSIMMRNKLK